MTTVELRRGESPEQLIRRFRKKVQRSRILTIAKRKRWYMKPSDIRRRKLRKAIRKQRKRQWRNERRRNRRRY